MLPSALAEANDEKTKMVYEPQPGLVSAPTMITEITDKTSSAALPSAKQPPQVTIYPLTLEGENWSISLSDGNMPVRQAVG